MWTTTFSEWLLLKTTNRGLYRGERRFPKSDLITWRLELVNPQMTQDHEEWMLDVGHLGRPSLPCTLLRQLLLAQRDSLPSFQHDSMTDEITLSALELYREVYHW